MVIYCLNVLMEPVFIKDDLGLGEWWNYQAND